MANPGWYPDPDGTPNRLRFWDGQAWTQQTTPAGGPPPGMSGQFPQQPGFQPTPVFQPQLPPPTRARRSLLIPILAIVVVLAMLAMYGLLAARGVMPGPFGGPTSAAPTTAATQQPSSAGITTLPGEPMSCDRYGGDFAMASGTDATRMYGGYLSMTIPAGWEPTGMPLDFAAVGEAVAHNVASGWVAPAALGKVAAADGFLDLQASAQGVVKCITEHPGLYPNVTGITEVISQPITVDGQPSYHIRTEIRIDDPDLPEIQGDSVDVILVDTGDPESFSFLFGAVPIGDTQLQAALDQSAATLRVER